MHAGQHSAPSIVRSSRRAALGKFGLAGGTALALAATPFATLAQRATPAAGELPPAVARFVAAMEAADAAAIAASYVPDGVLEEVGFGAVYTGQDQIRADEAGFLAGFPDAKISIAHAFAADGWAAVEFAFTGTYSGQVEGMPAGQGQTIAFRGASILQFNDEGIVRHTQYFDAYGILIQFGALPAPEAAPAATPAG